MSPDQDSPPLEHLATQGVQYEFYVPTAIWDHPATQRFFNRVTSLEAGATILPNLTGLWQRQAEQVHVVRVLAPNVIDRDKARALLLTEVEELMRQLDTDPNTRQQEILFAEHPILAIQVARRAHSPD